MTPHWPLGVAAIVYAFVLHLVLAGSVLADTSPSPTPSAQQSNVAASCAAFLTAVQANPLLVGDASTTLGQRRRWYVSFCSNLLGVPPPLLPGATPTPTPVPSTRPTTAAVAPTPTAPPSPTPSAPVIAAEPVARLENPETQISLEPTKPLSTPAPQSLSIIPGTQSSTWPLAVAAFVLSAIAAIGLWEQGKRHWRLQQPVYSRLRDWMRWWFV